MPLREAFELVLADYPAARNELFEGHKVAEFLRHDLPNMLRLLIGEFSAAGGFDFIVKGSAGQSQWVRCPWVAIFDPSSSARHPTKREGT